MAPPEKVFPLLCPVREIEWVPGWDPECVISRSGIAEIDCVFTTPASPQNSIWIITLYDPDDYRIEMLKVTPNHTVRKLEIVLSNAGDGGTRAEVVYTYTSLGPEGDVFLEAFTEDGYREFMERGEGALNHSLSKGEKITG